MIRAARAHTRRGFTLVELMVAAAVCVLIMAVLATAFSLGIDTMRQMKSTGDLMDQLRGATEILRTDLKNDHFIDLDPTQNPPRSRVRDQRLDQIKLTGTAGSYRVDSTGQFQTAGFFRARSTAVVVEGADADGLVSSRSTDHYLHFTTILPPGDSPEDSYTTTVPTAAGGTRTFQSRAAEIAYFLEGMGQNTAGATPLPMYRLIRRQRLAALNQTDLETRWRGAPVDDPAASPVLSIRVQSDGSRALNTLSDLVNPSNRLGGTSPNPGPPPFGPGYAVKGPGNDLDLAPSISRAGDDILLSNVISFEVQLHWDPAVPTGPPPHLTTVRGPDPFTPSAKSDSPFDTLPLKGANTNTSVPEYVFDTWAALQSWDAVDPNTGAYTTPANVPPYLIRVKAIQVRVRIWDPKLQNARQVTIVQDL